MIDQVPQTLGPYRILRQLGEGGAGRVFLATPTEDRPFARPGELVAIKEYNETALKDKAQEERARRELEIGMTIRHPNVVSAFELGKDGKGRPFLVMEYVDGDTLYTCVQMYHPIPNPILLQITEQIVDGICELHKTGAVHRDLKPSNVMLSEAFTAKIMDFGIVLPKPKHLDETAGVTPSNRILGTIRNAAPEYLVDGSCDERCDLYSFGTVLFYLLHGEEVFADETNLAKLIKLAELKEPAFDETIGTNDASKGRLLELCKRLLAKKPEDRPSSAQDVRETLQKERLMLPSAQRPLFAYIAAALTNLTPRDREGITFVGHAIAEVCKDLNIYAHQPRKATDPVLHREIPPEAVYLFDRRRIVSSDLIVAICNEPSFGVGQELEIAAAYGIPTLLVKRGGVQISRMVTGSCLNMLDDPIEYESPEELKKKLIRALKRNIESLGKRRDRTTGDSNASIGRKLRDLRTRNNWSIESTAHHLGIAVNMVNLIENNADHFHNIGTVILSRAARVFGVPLSDLLSLDRNNPQGGRIPDEANVALIEHVACTEDWPARDYIEMVRELSQEARLAAARGRTFALTKDEIHNRHSAILQKRLNERDFRLT